MSTNHRDRGEARERESDDFALVQKSAILGNPSTSSKQRDRGEVRERESDKFENLHDYM